MRNRETVVVAPEIGRNIVYDDSDHFTLIDESIEDQSRWSTHMRAIVQRNSDFKFFEIYYSQGSTESQYERPFEFDSQAELREVFKETVSTVVYK